MYLVKHWKEGENVLAKQARALEKAISNTEKIFSYVADLINREV